MNRITSWTRLTILALVCVVSVGCGGKGKPNKANFDQIKEGMSPKEVEELMGPAKETVDAKDMAGLGGGIPGMEKLAAAMPKVAVKAWEEGDTRFEVTFFDDKMKLKGSGSIEEMKKKKGGK